jgi:hypothetical protein
MDPWKIATFGLGAAWIATVLAAAWLGSELSQTRAALADAQAQAAVEATPGVERPRRPSALLPLGPAGRFREADDAADAAGPITVDPAQPLPPEILERAREQIRNEWRDRRELRMEQAREAFDRFVEEEELAPELADRAYELFDNHRARLEALRESAMTPGADRRQVREEFQAAREELQAGLVEIFGEEGAARLREELPRAPIGAGPIGPGGFGGGFGGGPGGGGL